VVVKTQNRKKEIAQGVVVKAANNLPLSSVLRIEGTRAIYSDEETQNGVVDYTAPTVTLSGTVDLNPIRTEKPRYTGTFIFVTANNEHYFIDRSSIDYNNKTFDIYEDPDLTIIPATIDESGGFEVAEAKLVNYLSVSSQAHIDEVNFRGFDVEFRLDAKSDSVAVRDSDGNELDIKEDGSVDVNTVTDAEQGDTIAISRHEDPYTTVQDNTLLAADFPADTFVEVFSQTSNSDNLRIRKATVKADTFGTFRLKIDGVILDYVRTSPEQRNCLFEFIEEPDFLNAQVLTIEFQPYRNRLTEYNFFTRLEGYNLTTPIY